MLCQKLSVTFIVHFKKEIALKEDWPESKKFKLTVGRLPVSPCLFVHISGLLNTHGTEADMEIYLHTNADA